MDFQEFNWPPIKHGPWEFTYLKDEIKINEPEGGLTLGRVKDQNQAILLAESKTQGIYTRVWVPSMKRWSDANVALISGQFLSLMVSYSLTELSEL